jgi:hypothetical protein
VVELRRVKTSCIVPPSSSRYPHTLMLNAKTECSSIPNTSSIDAISALEKGKDLIRTSGYYLRS